MKLVSIFVLSITASGFAGTTHWNFSESTGGENVHWTSPRAVDAQADQYEYTYEITYVGVDVIFLGIVIGPNDVTGDIDPELLFGTGVLDGPAPFTLMNEALEADGDSDGDIDIAANIHIYCNGKGYGQLDVTKIFFGDVYVDTGFPFGWQYVDIHHVYLDGYMDITPIIIECPADVNGDGTVSVGDILIAIGNWGSSGEGDVDGSGIVDVTDLLAIVGAWGPC